MENIRLQACYKSVTGILNRIIASETEYLKSQRQTLKDDELTILRLQNKARIMDIEIEERENLIKEYRSYQKDLSEIKFIENKSVSSEWKVNDKKFKLVKNLNSFIQK